MQNHFWSTSKRKVFKIGGSCTIVPTVILTLCQKSAVSAQFGVEFQKKILISSCLGTCLVNDYKTIFFLHARGGLHWPRKQKTLKSSQIRSKATMPQHSCRVVAKKFSLLPGALGQVGLLKLTNKMTIS